MLKDMLVTAPPFESISKIRAILRSCSLYKLYAIYKIIVVSGGRNVLPQYLSII